VTSYSSAPDTSLGIPIGSLTSQHLANSYLAPLDRFIKETLKIPGYVRYMDDMLLWADDKEILKDAKLRIEPFLHSLGLSLNPKWHLQPTACGANFLGYRVFPDGSTLSKKSRIRFLRKRAIINKLLAAGRISESEARPRSLSLCAFVRVAKKETILQRVFGRGVDASRQAEGPCGTNV